VRVGDEFGAYFARIPLKATPHIVHGNALRLDWNDVLPAERCSYVLGNPPWKGKHLQTPREKEEAAHSRALLDGGKSAVLDYVCAWFFCAARYMKARPAIRCAFVATNSIAQGEQVAALWAPLLAAKAKIHFAYKTFSWSNEASGNAAVHCVIIGWALEDVSTKTLYEQDGHDDAVRAAPATNINPYLVDAADVLIASRATPIVAAPRALYGSKPADDQNLLLTDSDRLELLKTEPQAAEFIKPLVSAEEMLHGTPRWCLWLSEATPSELLAMPAVRRRLEAVRAFRAASTKAQTRDAADTPTLFAELRQPQGRYIAIPLHSSEHRRYIPMAMFDADHVLHNSCAAIESDSVYHFGVLMSRMHMAWVAHVCGRIKSDFRYSNQVVYNNFPWPQPTAGHQQAIEQAAQAVLEARALFPGESLANLYHQTLMPLPLRKAHQKLDAAVDAAYPRPGKKGFDTDAERVAHLFERYRALTSLLPAEAPARKASGRKPRATPSAT
jgi:hypothetical protein